MRIKDAINWYCEMRNLEIKEGTINRACIDLVQFGIFFQNKDVASVKTEEVIEYLNTIKEMGVKQNAIYKKAMALRDFFRTLNKGGKPSLSYESIPVPRREYTVPRVVSKEEYKKLLDTIPADRFHTIRDRVIIQLLWDTGARSGELVALNVSDLDLEKCQAFIYTEKSRGKRPYRYIYWTKETNKELKKYLQERKRWEEKMVFPEPDALFISQAQQIRGKRFTNHGLAVALRKWSKRAGIVTANAHSFRHHMGHQIIKQGGSTSDVMNVLGHSDLNSSHLYTMMHGDEVKERWQKFRE